MNVYFIPGIGADKRLFKHILLPEGFLPHYLEWISPGKREPLPAYAMRLAAGIDQHQPFVLIGLSLGGIMAVEIAKRLSPACTIIIGSAPLSSQLPIYYRLARKINLLRVVPAVFFKCTASLKRLFTRESLTDKRDLLQMIWKGDASFIAWGMQAVLYWQNQEMPGNFYHLHGTRDEVFPVRLVRPTHTIKGGSHMLCLSHPHEVNAILQSILAIHLLPPVAMIPTA
ncbi:alpha/beta fold hydrolase [Dinghuibacter silviterrae]|uniref:Pimeloyl-ACP methyl ester carboxylesterase n=1 Tax=Dinghuibacter silviterrae TaxID=1539049 RepID=A0A4R8DI16_9BACT|nr:alpha/beta hydrolase [Dinghuibacter silviterrae]TDW97118.1 pimeloyl-ACP methyl ester carboxylesterase [Dinghuibacter silviterrae]